MSQVCYQLASQGVVVAALEHRDGSGCSSYFVEEKEGLRTSHKVPHEEVLLDREYERRNEQLNQRSHEIRKVIDVLAHLEAGQTVVNVVDDVDSQNVDLKFLTSSLDLKNNLHLLGHSFGGASVLLAAWQDSRVSSTMALDPWMFPLSRQEFKIDKPTTVVNTEKFVNANNVFVIKRAAVKGTRVKLKVLESGVHLSATDVPMVSTTFYLLLIVYHNFVDVSLQAIENRIGIYGQDGSSGRDEGDQPPGAELDQI